MFYQTKLFICVVLLSGFCACVGNSQLLEMQSRIIEQQNKLDELSQKSKNEELQREPIENERKMIEKNKSNRIASIYMIFIKMDMLMDLLQAET